MQNYNGYFSGNQQQDKTFVSNGLWFQEVPLLPAQYSSALQTTQPQGFQFKHERRLIFVFGSGEWLDKKLQAVVKSCDSTVFLD
jgi:hypothetical protein